MSSDHPSPGLGPKPEEVSREIVRILAESREPRSKEVRQPSSRQKRRDAKLTREFIRMAYQWLLPYPLVQHILLKVSRDSQLPDPRGCHDLPDLIAIGRLVLQNISPWAAAGEIAKASNSNPRVYPANQKRLYKYYLKDAAIYLRLAQAPDFDACFWQIFHERHEAQHVASVLREFTASQQTG